jgi:hypothetical protein
MRPLGIFTLLLLVVIAALIIRAVLQARANRLRPYVLEPRPAEIMDALKQAPVLEQSRARKAYQGLKVRWYVTFESAIPLSPIGLRLMLQDRGDFPWVICDVRKQKYPELRGLVQHTPFWVSGQISQIKPDEIILKNAQLEFEA